MQVSISTGVKFEGIHYSAGTITVADDLGLRMINSGIATLYPKGNSLRPYLVSFGDSINAQDYPTDGSGVRSDWVAFASPNPSSVSPMFWTNALTRCAFDFMGPVSITGLANTQGNQKATYTFTNGVTGYSGGLITDFMTNAIDTFITNVQANCGNRMVYCLLGGGMNDFNNNDVANYDEIVFAAQLVIINKLLAANIYPICKVGELSALLDTNNKKRNAESYRQRMLAFSKIEKRLTVADMREGVRKFGKGIPHSYLTRRASTVIGTGNFTTTAGSNIVTFTAGAQAPAQGQVLSFSDGEATFPYGTFVKSVTNSTTIVVSNNALTNNTGASVTISVGDGVHPNATLAIIYALTYADALQDKVTFCPPWERQDFAGVLQTADVTASSYAGTIGTNALSGSLVPTNFTLASYGANTQVLGYTDVYSGSGKGYYLDAQATGAPVADRIGLDSAAPAAPNTTNTYQAFLDFDVIQADYVASISGQVRGTTGSDLLTFPLASSSDNLNMTTDWPNAYKLLEGKRIVLATFPFKFPASSQGGIRNVGGGGGLTKSGGRLRTHTRFAGTVLVG